MHPTWEPPREHEFYELREGFRTDSHRLFVDLSWFTLAKPDEILRLRVSDVFDLGTGLPRPSILYVRCGRLPGRVLTRRVKLGEQVRALAAQYQPVGEGWLIPSPITPDKPLGMRAIAHAFKRAMERSGFSDRTWSLMSIRQGAYSHLRLNGYEQFSVDLTLSLEMGEGYTDTTGQRWRATHGG